MCSSAPNRRSARCSTASAVPRGGDLGPRSVVIASRSCQEALLMVNARHIVIHLSTVLAPCVAAALSGTALMPVMTAQQTVSPRLYSGLHWRMIGPFRGARVHAVSGVPGQPNTFYFGSVGGGVWESVNAGGTWSPVFDRQAIASVGAIGVAPSDPES